MRQDIALRLVKETLVAIKSLINQTLKQLNKIDDRKPCCPICENDEERCECDRD